MFQPPRPSPLTATRVLQHECRRGSLKCIPYTFTWTLRGHEACEGLGRCRFLRLCSSLPSLPSDPFHYVLYSAPQATRSSRSTSTAVYVGEGARVLAEDCDFICRDAHGGRTSAATVSGGARLTLQRWVPCASALQLGLLAAGLLAAGLLGSWACWQLGWGRGACMSSD
jgi:hypothetical protein